MIGDKIRFFRKRSGVSQFDLETAIEASPGSLSRIENGSTNPTKETLHKIIKHLHLNLREQNYLSELYSEEPTEKEINGAIEEVENNFKNENVFAYLIDEGYNVYFVSDAMSYLLGSNPGEIRKIYGMNIFEILFKNDTGVNIFELISEDEKDFVILSLIKRYIDECSFMVNSRHYNVFQDLLNSNTDFRKYYELAKDLDIPFNTQEYRRVTFDINGDKIQGYYSNEYLISNARFEIVEYIFQK